MCNFFVYRPKKPPFTYTELIEYALEDKGELTVSGIYQWISWVVFFVVAIFYFVSVKNPTKRKNQFVSNINMVTQKTFKTFAFYLLIYLIFILMAICRERIFHYANTYGLSYSGKIKSINIHHFERLYNILFELCSVNSDSIEERNIFTKFTLWVLPYPFSSFWKISIFRTRYETHSV